MFCCSIMFQYLNLWQIWNQLRSLNLCSGRCLASVTSSFVCVLHVLLRWIRGGEKFLWLQWADGKCRLHRNTSENETRLSKYAIYRIQQEQNSPDQSTIRVKSAKRHEKRLPREILDQVNTKMVCQKLHENLQDRRALGKYILWKKIGNLMYNGWV